LFSKVANSIKGERIINFIFNVAIILGLLSIFVSTIFCFRESAGEKKGRLEKIETERRK